MYGTSGNCKNYIDNYIFNYPLAIVIGGENKGLSKNIQKKCDDLISIKMTGNTESFNMSVAASIFLYVTSAKKSDWKLLLFFIECTSLLYLLKTRDSNQKEKIWDIMKLCS